MPKRVLVTGCGGPAAINFTRALMAAPEEFYLVGTDAGKWLHFLSPIEKRYRVPRAKDPNYVQEIKRIIEKEKIEFLHPQPDVEVEVMSRNLDELNVRTLLPKLEVVEILRDKYRTYEFFRDKGIPVPETKIYTIENLEELANKYGWPVWLRARRGAGARLSLPVYSVEEAEKWVKLWNLRGISVEEFIVQEYLPGKDAAWDSLWYKGKLVGSYSRERLEYIYPHLSPSGLTGTPTVARVYIDKKMDDLGEKAVKALDKEASGFYCFDVKYKEGKPYLTEINPRPHTTFSLWCYAGVKALGLEYNYNLPYVYVKLGFGEDIGFPGRNMFPEGITLIRHIDAGAIILFPDGSSRRVL